MTDAQERASAFLAVARRTWVLVSCLLALGAFEVAHGGGFAWASPGFWTGSAREPHQAAAVLIAALLLHPLWPRWWTAALAWCATALWIAYVVMLAGAGC